MKVNKSLERMTAVIWNTEIRQSRIMKMIHTVSVMFVTINMKGLSSLT